MLHWSRPEFLVLLATLPWFWWSTARAARRPTPRATILRSAIALLVTLAAAGTSIAVRDGRLTVMYALDRSDSITPRGQSQALARINGWSETMRRGDKAGIVVFGSDPVLERAPVDRLLVPEITSTVSASGTNLSAALAGARAALSSQGERRIVLLSDGQQTAGDVQREAALLASQGVAVEVMPADDASAGARVLATRVEAPADVRANEPFLVSVEFAGRPGGKGQLTVTRDGQPFAARAVVVPDGGTGSVAFPDQHHQGGVHGYQATVRDELDEDLADDAPADSAGTVVSVVGPPAVMYVTDSSPAIAAVLERQGFRVTTAPPRALPASASALGAFDAIVLDDVASDRLQEAQLAAIKAYVEQSGGGLLLLGSPRSLDAGGYPAGPLGALLPVDLRPRTGRRAPSMAFVLVFDKSGSMADLAGGVPKIELARQSVMKMLDVVPGSDPLGIIAFDAAPVTVAPLSNSRDAEMIAARLRDLKPGGSTAIAPAMETALAWLGDAGPVARRHILLLSDGRSTPADARRVRDAVRRLKVEVSVVAIGADADRPMLEELARSTGGRAFFPRDLQELPRIVAREAARAAGGTVVEEPFTVRVTPHPIVTGLDTSVLPQLGGYVVSATKPGAETVLSSHLDDPVLATARAGLGKVAVYTGDLGSVWSARLRAWNGATGLWTQSMRWLSRSTDARGLSAQLREKADGARLVVEAWQPDVTFASDLAVQAEVRGPDGDRESIILEEVAPGRYESAVHVGPNGPYTIAIAARAANGDERRILRGFYWSSDREHRTRGTDMRMLAGIAAVTGGHVLGAGDSPFNAPRQRDFLDVSSWLAAAALLLFFGDITLGAIRTTRPGAWLMRRARNADGAQAT
jgi:Mg-chelatase subunit ChlD